MTWREWLVFGLLGVIWGLPYFFIKLALVEIAPAGVACGRLALGALILLPIAWRRGSLLSLSRYRAAIVGFAFAELVVPFFLIALGESWISSSLAGILIATLPLTVIVLAPLIGLHEPLGARRVLGLVCGFAGVVVLLGLSSVDGLKGWLGVACLLVATTGYALASMIVQRYLAAADQLGAVAVSLAVAAIVLLPAALWTVPSHMPSAVALTSVAVLGVVCTAIPLVLYVYLVSRAGAARATIITYINPAVATALGVAFLHESFGAGAAIGMGMILCGSWLGTRGAGQRDPLRQRGSTQTG